MPTVRELVSAIRQRPGIDAAMVVGRDGLVIAGDVAPHVDPDELAARLPPLIESAEQLGNDVRTLVIEHGSGHAVVLPLDADAMLVVLAGADAEVAGTIRELRRFRSEMARVVNL